MSRVSLSGNPSMKRFMCPKCETQRSREKDKPCVVCVSPIPPRKDLKEIWAVLGPVDPQSDTCDAFVSVSKPTHGAIAGLSTHYREARSLSKLVEELKYLREIEQLVGIEAQETSQLRIENDKLRGRPRSFRDTKDYLEELEKDFKEALKENSELETKVNSNRMSYVGALSLLCQCAVHVDDDLRESIEWALRDGCADGKLRYRKILNSFELAVVPDKSDDNG